MPTTIVRVDAFSAGPGSGNPAAVCLLAAHADTAWMQAVAAEMDLPATAFVRRRDDGFALRWFTPRVELELCGHGTLAAAHVLAEDGLLPVGGRAPFTTLAGPLAAERRDGWIELDFPAEPAAPAEPPPDLLAALGVPAKWVGRNRLDYLVEVDAEATVRALAPDLGRLATVATRGVIVTSASDDPRFDFVSRFFAPRVGIPEDLVTGSAHCCLGPFWAPRLGQRELTAYQASARGGVVRVRVAGDRALLAGHAITVLRTELGSSPRPGPRRSGDPRASARP
jgi:PhzF family phenazine biosynthesis protein